jgi:hypothetical protein
LIRTYYGHTGTLFGILSTYESYRIFWSNPKEDDEIAFKQDVNLSQVNEQLENRMPVSSKYTFFFHFSFLDEVSSLILLVVQLSPPHSSLKISAICFVTVMNQSKKCQQMSMISLCPIALLNVYYMWAILVDSTIQVSSFFLLLSFLFSHLTHMCATDLLLLVTSAVVKMLISVVDNQLSHIPKALPMNLLTFTNIGVR